MKTPALWRPTDYSVGATADGAWLRCAVPPGVDLSGSAFIHIDFTLDEALEMADKLAVEIRKLLSTVQE